jgi:hypothetical protein
MSLVILTQNFYETDTDKHQVCGYRAYTVQLFFCLSNSNYSSTLVSFRRAHRPYYSSEHPINRTCSFMALMKVGSDARKHLMCLSSPSMYEYRHSSLWSRHFVTQQICKISHLVIYTSVSCLSEICNRESRNCLINECHKYFIIGYNILILQQSWEKNNKIFLLDIKINFWNLQYPLEGISDWIGQRPEVHVLWPPQSPDHKPQAHEFCYRHRRGPEASHAGLVTLLVFMGMNETSSFTVFVYPW